MKLFGKNTVANKLIVYIVLFSTFVTIILSVIELTFDYHRNIISLKERVEQIRDSHLKTLALRLWNLDEEGLETQLNGIVQLPDIENVKIIEISNSNNKENNSEVFSAGKVVSKNTLENEFLLYSIDNHENVLGKLIIVSSLDNIYNRLLNKAAAILLSNTIKTFFVAIFVFFIFQFLVTRYLIKITNYAENVNEENDTKPLNIARYNLKGKEVIYNDELSKLANAINIMNSKLKRHSDCQRQAAIGQSASMIAHDIRKPLALLKSLLTILPEKRDDEEFIKKMVRKIERTINRTNSMLSEILDFSMDATSLNRKNHDLQSLITSTLSDIFTERNDIAVAIDYDLKHRNYLNVDSDRIIRLFANIVGNAIEAMRSSTESDHADGKIWFRTEDISDRPEPACPPSLRSGVSGQVEGRAEEKRPSTSSGRTEWYMKITIGNDGPPIPEDVRKKLFEPFFTKGKKGGTGLGLAICQKIVEMHNGAIRVTSTPSPLGGEGQGEGDSVTEFTLILPASPGNFEVNEDELIYHSDEFKVFREEDAARTEYGDSASTTEFMKLHKKHGKPFYLLLVDDEPLFRETIQSLLRSIPQVRDHVKVVECGNAEDALKLFTAREFDYVIADIDMGKRKMNGYEMSEKILKKYPNTYVLIHSNKRREEMDKSIREINCSRFMGFLPKPMKQWELLQFLARKTFESSQVRKLASSQVRKLPSSQVKKILILNDDDSLQISFRIILKSPERKILQAMNVDEAMEHLTKEKIDIILSDINLGSNEPNGYDFLKKVREKHSALPFYLVSGYSRNEEEPKAKKHGATGYLQLPVSTEQLLGVVNDK